MLDIFVLMVVAFDTELNQLTLTNVTAIRGSIVTFLPIPVLILTSLLPASFKAVLVYWRIKNPLPGSRAFSEHARKDHRINLEKLRENVGEFPLDARKQNAKWYELYRQVKDEPSVIDSHKNYLLFRDIAALSLLLIPIVPSVMYFFDLSTFQMTVSSGWFFFQYIISALAGRNAGNGFVKNVLSIHAGSKVRSP